MFVSIEVFLKIEFGVFKGVIGGMLLFEWEFGGLKCVWMMVV